jgi:hypothetical protein
LKEPLEAFEDKKKKQEAWFSFSCPPKPPGALVKADWDPST